MGQTLGHKEFLQRLAEIRATSDGRLANAMPAMQAIVEVLEAGGYDILGTYVRWGMEAFRRQADATPPHLKMPDLLRAEAHLLTRATMVEAAGVESLVQALLVRLEGDDGRPTRKLAQCWLACKNLEAHVEVAIAANLLPPHPSGVGV